MSNRRVVITVSTEEHSEIVARAGGQDKVRNYARRRLLGEPAATLAERYRMALEAISTIDPSITEDQMQIVKKISDKALER